MIYSFFSIQIEKPARTTTLNKSQPINYQYNTKKHKSHMN